MFISDATYIVVAWSLQGRSTANWVSIVWHWGRPGTCTFNLRVETMQKSHIESQTSSLSSSALNWCESGVVQKKITSFSELCFDIFKMGTVDSPRGDCCSMIYDIHLGNAFVGCWSSFYNKTWKTHFYLGWPRFRLNVAIDKDAIGECPRTSAQSFSSVKNMKKE